MYLKYISIFYHILSEKQRIFSDKNALIYLNRLCFLIFTIILLEKIKKPSTSSMPGFIIKKLINDLKCNLLALFYTNRLTFCRLKCNYIN